MAFGDNTNLDTTTTITVVTLNGTNDIIDISDGSPQGNPNDQADSLVFGNGAAGDDQIVGFGKNDSILNYTKIFDGNGDTIIDFGPNGILDIDRVSAKNAGADQITLLGMESKQLRHLGQKEGYFVYADASVKLKGFIEGTVGDNVFDASTGNRTYFYDTALGLNLGGDTITGFGVGDRIVTTTRIHNGPDEGAKITFGSNKILDLPGDTDGIKGDVGPAEGGQIDFNSPEISGLFLISTSNVGGVDYFYYGAQIAA